MSKIDDGGPAYPCEQHETLSGAWNQTFEPGMSLRAHIAALALQGMIAAGGKVGPAEDRVGERMCGVAVAMADTLIAELRKGEAS